MEPKEVIYSLGLIDYLQDEIVVKLLNWSFDNLLPGGKTALGNFAADSDVKAFMDHVAEWVLIHLTPDEMRELFRRSHFGDTIVHVDRDESSVQLMAWCRKN